MASKDVPVLEVGQVWRVLDTPTEFTYAAVISTDPVRIVEETTMKRLYTHLTDIERDPEQFPPVGIIQRHVWDDAIGTWYLVCRQCGEAFDSITTARGHTPQECGSWQGFDLLPESEAM